MQLKPMGSFEGWSAAVREPIVWAGLPDPAANRRELARRADQDAIGLGRLIEGWSEIDPNGTGLTVAEAVKMLEDDPNAYPVLRSAISELAPARGGKSPSTRSIGMKMHHLQRRVVGQKYLDKQEAKLGSIWFVRTVDQGGTRGTRGTKTNPSQVRTQAHTGARGNRGAIDFSPSSPL